MKTLHDIQTDIGALSADERAALLSWLLDADRQAWDEQISQDFSTGGAGMKLLVDVDDQIRNGGFRPME
jgi:hypothetical protein